MCIDFTGLNKACPKDPFALTRIDQIIDFTAGSELLCFLDAYSGYHQIKLIEEDELKTSFITPFGVFVTKQCLLDSRMQEQHIRDAFRIVFESKLEGTSMHM